MTLLAVLTTVVLIATTLARPQGTPPPLYSSPLGSDNKAISCAEAATRLYLQDGSHDNYFYSDCRTSVHVIVTSPQPGSDSTTAKPRLLVAWPAGNSGAMAMFASENGNQSLGVKLEQSDEPLTAFNDSTRVGISGSINFNSATRLTVPILGSIRSIRDFTEGGNVNQDFQDDLGFALHTDGGASINRTWFDGVTTTTLSFTPLDGSAAIMLNQEATWTLTFGAGTYRFEASYNYPQLEQLSPQEVLTDAVAPDLIPQYPDQTTSLSFLSYTDKLLAGTWRFLTYFGRDSMISMLLMQPILSDQAIEAVISAVLERINRTDGTVCHEEVIGDYATWLNQKDGINSSAPRCDYKMIDTDFLLPVAMKTYFVDTESGRQRSDDFFRTTATFLTDNNGLSYAQLAQFTAEKIMRLAAPFAENPIKENLIHLKEGEQVGEWRDSNNGLGGGRIPYDVNAALIPASLRAIAALSLTGFFPEHENWGETAARYAQTWEDLTLRFFAITIPASTATSLVQSYISNANLSIPIPTPLTSAITYHGLALTPTSIIPVMNTDDSFRHYFLNTTNQTQLSAYLSQTADHILAPFPVGLSSDVGLFVANAAFAGDGEFEAGFSRTEYHGCVVWSWQVLMMGVGVGRQLGRCIGDETLTPEFCNNTDLYNKIRNAYNHLWDLIDANQDQLGHEMWSWKYEGGRFQVVQFGDLTSTESNVRQLWSLASLAARRVEFS